jgi:hypothetical protein
MSQYIKKGIYTTGRILPKKKKLEMQRLDNLSSIMMQSIELGVSKKGLTYDEAVERAGGLGNHSIR